MQLSSTVKTVRRKLFKAVLLFVTLWPLFDALCKYRPKETEDDISKEFTLLMTAYRDAPSKTVKLQILSLYAYRFSTEKLMKYHEPYEPLTRWQIKQARKHAKEKGPGMPQEKNISTPNSPSNG